MNEKINRLIDLIKATPNKELALNDYSGNKEVLLDLIKSHPAFQNTKTIDILDSPTYLNENDEPKVVVRCNLADDKSHLKSRIQLYSIGILAIIYNPKDLDLSKGGVYVSPVMYDETTLKPYKTISVTLSPEDHMDNNLNENDIRDFLKQQFDQGLNMYFDNETNYPAIIRFYIRCSPGSIEPIND